MMTAPTEIVQRATGDFIPYAHNPRKNDQAVDRMVASITEFGFTVPILCQSDGLVVDGHLRLKAAMKLGLERVPAILCDQWSEAQVKAFRLLANRSVNWAEWDDALLGMELTDLHSLEYPLAQTGFTQEELIRFRQQIQPVVHQAIVQFDEQFLVLVTCRDEGEQLKLIERLLADGVNVRAMNR